jgi:hypothetical protein
MAAPAADKGVAYGEGCTGLHLILHSLDAPAVCSKV